MTDEPPISYRKLFTDLANDAMRRRLPWRVRFRLWLARRKH